MRVRSAAHHHEWRGGGVAAVLLLVLSGPWAAAEQVYKWVDEHGKVHFGDKPPATVETEEITIRKAPTPDPDQAGRQRRTERLLETLSEERQERVDARHTARVEKKERAGNCARARRNLAMHEQSNRMYRYDEDGAVEYLDEKARLDAGVLAREAVTQWCD